MLFSILSSVAHHVVLVEEAVLQVVKPMVEVVILWYYQCLKVDMLVVKQWWFSHLSLPSVQWKLAISEWSSAPRCSTSCSPNVFFTSVM